MVKLDGRWKYQSYRPEPGSLAADPEPPKFVSWSPPGIGLVTIDKGGTTGTLEFTGTPIKLDLKIQVTNGSPGGLSISAAMKLSVDKQFTNELQGWFVKVDDESNPLVVRGSILQTSEDIAPIPQPMFTTGFFILERL